MKPIIETERTFLREMDEDDFLALSKVLHGPDGGPRSDAEVHRWISWCRDCYAKYGFGHWAVVLKETGEMIGSVGISMQMIDDGMKPEVGYHLRSDYHRMGLGKETATACRDYFFENFDFDEVYSYMNKDNVASYSLALANGMTYLHLYTTKGGEVCRVYRITRDEWEAIRR